MTEKKEKEKHMTLSELRELMVKLKATKPVREGSNPIMERYHKKLKQEEHKRNGTKEEIPEEKRKELEFDSGIKILSKRNSLSNNNIIKIKRLNSFTNDPELLSLSANSSFNLNNNNKFRRGSSFKNNNDSKASSSSSSSVILRDKAGYSSSSKGIWNSHYLNEAFQFNPTTYFTKYVRSPWYLFILENDISHTFIYPHLFPQYNNNQKEAIESNNQIIGQSFDLGVLTDGLNNEYLSLSEKNKELLDKEKELIKEQLIEDNLPNDFYFYPGSKQFYWLLLNEPKPLHQLVSLPSSFYTPSITNGSYRVKFKEDNIIGNTPSVLDLNGWIQPKNITLRFIEEELRRFNNNLLPKTNQTSSFLSLIPHTYFNTLRQGGLESYLYLAYQNNPNILDVSFDYTTELISTNIFQILLGFFQDNSENLPPFFIPSISNFSASFNGSNSNLLSPVKFRPSSSHSRPISSHSRPSSSHSNNQSPPYSRSSSSFNKKEPNKDTSKGVKKLSFKGCIFEDSSGLLSSWSYLSMMTSLVSLDLSYCNQITDRVIQLILTNSTSSVIASSSSSSSNQSFSNPSIYNPISNSLSETSPLTLIHLEELYLNGNNNITSKCLKFIAKTLNKKLKKVSFSCCPLITNEGVNSILLKCPNLEELDLSFSYQISFIGLYKEKKVKLMDLPTSINNEQSKEKDVEVDMIQRKIKKLNLNGLSSLVIESLNWISISLPYLEELYLEKVVKTNDSIIKNLAGSTRYLEILDLTGCYLVTLEGLEFFIQYSFEREKIRKEREINLLLKNNENNYDDNENKNENLNEIVSNSRSLKVLLCSLIDDNNFDNKKGNELLKKKLDYLQHLDLSHNKSLRNDFFENLFDPKDRIQNSTLLTLDISYSSINSYGVVSLSSYFTSLIHLNLSGLVNLNDLSLQAISKYLSSLQVLKLNGCLNLTDVGVSSVVLSCSQLTHLHLMYYDPYEDLMNDLSGNFFTAEVKSSGEQYSDELLYLIIKKSRNLVHLDLTGQLKLILNKIKKYFNIHSNISSNSGKKKFLNLSLEKLVLSECNNINYLNIQYLISILYSLNSLFLPACWFANQETSTPTSNLAPTLTYFLNSKNFKSLLSERKYIKNYNEDNYLQNELKYIKKSYLKYVNIKKNLIPKNFDFSSSFSYIFSSINPLQLIEKIRKLRGFHYIQPSKNYDQLKHNDALINYILLLINNKNKIIQVYRSYKYYKKFKLKINGRKIYKFFLHYFNIKKFNKKLSLLIEKNSGKRIGKFIFYNYFIKKKKLFIIKRFLIKVVKKRRENYYNQKISSIIIIQKNVRRFLHRISDEYFVFLLYKYLPPFWKQVANFELDSDGKSWGMSFSSILSNIQRFKKKKISKSNHDYKDINEKIKENEEIEKFNKELNEKNKISANSGAVPTETFFSTSQFSIGNPLPVVGVEKYELSSLRNNIKGMLYTIDNDVFLKNIKKVSSSYLSSSSSTISSSSFRSSFAPQLVTTFPSLPTYIPQFFDLEPYASLSDGTKISITSSGDNLLSEEFISKIQTKAKEVITAEFLDYVDGYNPLYKNKLSENKKDIVFNSNEFDPIIEKELPLHSFHNVYWPITKPIKKTVNKKFNYNTLVYDPSKDYFNRHNISDEIIDDEEYDDNEDDEDDSEEKKEEKRLKKIEKRKTKGERIREIKRERKNQLLASNKTKLNHCVNCFQRIALLYCVTCSKNLCFFCLYNDHIGGPPNILKKDLTQDNRNKNIYEKNNLNSRRVLKFHHKIKFLYPYSHNILSSSTPSNSLISKSSSHSIENQNATPIPPSLAFHTSSYSLIHSLNQSENIFFELNYLLKFLRNQSEIIRLKKEKEMLKAYEKEQEERQANYLKLREKFFNKISKIVLIQKFIMAKKQKRLKFAQKIQSKIEEKSIETNNIVEKIIKFQALFRRYYTRNFLFTMSIKIFYTFSPYIRKNKYGLIERVEPIKKKNTLNEHGQNVDDDDNIYEEFDDANLYNLIGTISQAKKKMKKLNLVSSTAIAPTKSIINESLLNSSSFFSYLNLSSLPKKIYRNLSDVQSLRLNNFLLTQLSTKVSIDRSYLISLVQQNYINLLKFLYTNINYWKKIGVKLENSLQNDRNLLKELKDELKEIQSSNAKFNREKESETYSFSALSRSSSSSSILTTKDKKKDVLKDAIDRKKAFLQTKIKIVQEKLSNKTNLVWWITQHLRTTVRQFQTLPYKLLKLMERLIWVEKESYSIDRVLYLSKQHMTYYLHYLKENAKKGKIKDYFKHGREENSASSHSNPPSSLEDPIKWLQEKIIQCELQKVELDKYQETILKTEGDNIQKLTMKINSCCNLIQELHSTIISFNKLSDERIFIEKKIVSLSAIAYTQHPQTSRRSVLSNSRKNSFLVTSFDEFDELDKKIDENKDDKEKEKVIDTNINENSFNGSNKRVSIPSIPTNIPHLASTSSSARTNIQNAANSEEEDELIQYNKNLLDLRNKQKILFSNNFDDLKLTLSKLYDELDLLDVTEYFFVNDSLEISVKKIDGIKAFPVPVHSTLASLSFLMSSLRNPINLNDDNVSSSPRESIYKFDEKIKKKNKNKNKQNSSQPQSLNITTPGLTNSNTSSIPSSSSSSPNNPSLLSLPKNFNPLDDFLRILYMQPWLASETLKDLKVKEKLMNKKLKLEEYEEELKELNLYLNELKSKEVELENEKSTLNNLLEVYLDPNESEESYEQYNQRMDKMKEIKDRLNKINIELIGNSTTYEKIKNKPALIEKEIKVLTNSNKVIEKNLLHNKKKKKKIYELFFNLESNILKSIIDDINFQILNLNEEISTKMLERNRLNDLLLHSIKILSSVYIFDEKNDQPSSTENPSSRPGTSSILQPSSRPGTSSILQPSSRPGTSVSTSSHATSSTPSKHASLSNYFITNSTVKLVEWPNFLPPLLNTLTIEKNLHVLKPMTHSGIVVFAFYEYYKEKLNRDYLIEKMANELNLLKNELSLYKNILNSYEEEKKKNSNSLNKPTSRASRVDTDDKKDASTASLKYLSNQVSLLLNSLNQQEDLKSKDLELELRRERLAKLRGIRLENQLKIDLKKQEEKALQEKLNAEYKDSSVEDESKGQASGAAATLARKIRKKARQLEDELWKLKYSNDNMMDEEEKRMARGIREKAGAEFEEEKKKQLDEGDGEQEVKNKTLTSGGIKSVLFTWGEEQKAAYKKQNKYLKTRGLPYFIPLPRSLGAHLTLWTETSFNPSLYITDIKLSHIDDSSPYYIELEKKYEEVLIDADRVFDTGAEGEEGAEKGEEKKKSVYASAPPIYAKLKLLVRRSKSSSYGIQSIALSLSEEEENNLILEGYEKLEPNLSEFNLPDGFIWVLKKSKSDQKKRKNINAIVGEVVRAKQIVEENPDNKIALEHLQKCQEKLEGEIKLQSDQLGKIDPIKESIRLMALDDDELEDWIKHFKVLDKNRESKVTYDTILSYYGLPNTDVIKEIFLSVDAFTTTPPISLSSKKKNSVDSDTLYVEFGDYMRAISTYCFFGKDELLRFHFLFGDKEKKGYLTQKEFHELIELINVYDKKRARKSLKILNIPANSRVSFEDFCKMSDSHPSLLNQAFLTQIELRKMSMGEKFYYKKLSKYKEVRKKLTSQDSMADELVKIEWERFKKDEARRARIENRKIEIENSSSEVKKAILNARQVLDELL